MNQNLNTPLKVQCSLDQGFCLRHTLTVFQPAPGYKVAESHKAGFQYESWWSISHASSTNMFMERPRCLILWPYYCLHFNSLGTIKKINTFQRNLRYIHRESKNKNMCFRAFLYTQHPFEGPGPTYNSHVLCPGSNVSLLCRTPSV